MIFQKIPNSISISLHFNVSLLCLTWKQFLWSFSHFWNSLTFKMYFFSEVVLHEDKQNVRQKLIPKNIFQVTWFWKRPTCFEIWPECIIWCRCIPHSFSTTTKFLLKNYKACHAQDLFDFQLFYFNFLCNEPTFKLLRSMIYKFIRHVLLPQFQNFIQNNFVYRWVYPKCHVICRIFDYDLYLC